MFRIYRKATRIAVVGLLFFFLFPSMSQYGKPNFGQRITRSQCASYVAILIPDLLMENEENEGKESSTATFSVPLLDLAHHTFRLQTIHQGIRFIFAHVIQTTQTRPGTALHCKMLI